MPLPPKLSPGEFLRPGRLIQPKLFGMYGLDAGDRAGLSGSASTWRLLLYGPEPGPMSEAIPRFFERGQYCQIAIYEIDLESGEVSVYVADREDSE